MFVDIAYAIGVAFAVFAAAGILSGVMESVSLVDGSEDEESPDRCRHCDGNCIIGECKVNQALTGESYKSNDDE